MTDKALQAPDKWSRTERLLLAAAQEPGVKRTISAICESAGVARKTFYRRMRQNPAFEKAWDRAWRRAIEVQMPGLVAAQVHRGLDGDTKAFRALAEVGGYTDKDETNVNVQVNQIDVESERGAIEIARRARFMYDNWLQYGGPEPPEWVIKTCAKLDAETAERQRHVESLAEPSSGDVTTLPDTKPESAPPKRTRFEDTVDFSEDGLPTGCDYAENALPLTVLPKVKTRRD